MSHAAEEKTVTWEDENDEEVIEEAQDEESYSSYTSSSSEESSSDEPEDNQANWTQADWAEMEIVQPATWIVQVLECCAETSLPMEPFQEVPLFDIKCQDTQYSLFGKKDKSWNPADLIDLRLNPTHVILDLGCTRSMGSLRAIEAFIEAAKPYGIRCEWKRCWTHMSFANGQSEWLEWCIVAHFPYKSSN